MYAVYDFVESLDRAGIAASDIRKVLFAFGEGYGWAEWAGGFLLAMKNNDLVLLTGWCDSTGWGCQDSVQVARVEDIMYEAADGDVSPADLNQYLLDPESIDDLYLGLGK